MIGGKLLYALLRASSVAWNAEERGMLGFGERIMSAGFGMIVSVL